MNFDSQGSTLSYRTRYISSEPIEDDGFRSRSHQRISDALAVEISELEEVGGSIGLEGAWGSGKSTVLRILSRKLSESAQSDPVFSFDAWAHQSDPFKGAFLDTLIDWIVKNFPVHETRLAQKQKELRGRVEKTEERSRSLLTWTGVAILFVGLLIPAAYMWLSPFAFGEKLAPEIFGIPLAHFRALALLIVLLPVLVILLRWKLGLMGLTRERVSLQTAASQLTEADKSVVVTRELENSDPTTNVFSEFLIDVLKPICDSGNTIKIVIDNVDRLPSDKLLDVWADVHALVSLSHLETLKLVTIVPYDRAHVVNALGAKNDEQTFIAEDDIFQKMFTRVLRVTEPLATDWHAFLDKSIVEAFGPGVPKQDTYVLQRLLGESFRARERRQLPTPRRIISFVNDLVSLYRLRGDEVCLPSIAAYALKRQAVAEDPNVLATGQVLSATEKSLLQDVVGDNWQVHLAALHFGVAPDLAIALLLDDDVEDALRFSDISVLTSLSETPGFSDGLCRVIEAKALNWAREAPSEFANACSVVLQLDAEGPHIAQALRSLARCLANLRTIRPFTPDKFAPVFDLLKRIEGEVRSTAAHSMREWITRNTTADDDDGDQMELGHQWAEGNRLLLGALEPSLPSNFIAGLNPPPKQRTLLGIAEYGFENGLEWISKVPVPVGVVSLEDGLIRLANEESPAVFSAQSGFMKWTTLQSTDRLADELSNKLGTTSVWNDQTKRSAFVRALELATRGIDIEGRVLDAHLQDGTMLAIWQKCYKDANKPEANDGDAPPDETLIAALAATTQLIIEKYGGNDLPPSANSPLGDASKARQEFITFRDAGEHSPTLVTNLAHLAALRNRFQRIAEFSISSATDESLFVAILKEMINCKLLGGLNLRKASSLVGELELLLTEQELTALIDRLAGWRAHFRSNFEGQARHLSASFLNWISKPEFREKYSELFDIVENDLAQLDAEEWRKSLSREDDNVRLLLSVLSVREFSLSSSALHDPLLEHATDVVTNQNQPTKYVEDWHRLPRALLDEARSSLYRNLVDLLRNSPMTTASASAFVNLYSGLLDEDAALLDPDVIASRLVSPLLRSDKPDDIELLSSRSSRLKPLLAKATTENQGLLRDDLMGSSMNDEDQKVLARQLGIERSPRRKSN